MATPETRQDDALTNKQACYPLICFTTIALAVAVFMPGETGAWSADGWLPYWGLVFGLGAGAGLLIKGISYLKPKAKS